MISYFNRILTRTSLHSNLRKLQVGGIHTSITAHGKLTIVNECNGVREIVLNDPKTRNSLSMAMMTELHEEIRTNINDTSLRLIILSATGPVFSAGHNLKELGSSQYPQEIFEKLSTVILGMREAPIPIIAKVDGLAAAAGCQLVASCDMLVCSERSSFSTPGSKFGIFCSTPGIAVARTMPRMKSAYMLFTGLPINAQEACAAGLVSKVVPTDKLDEEIKIISDSILEKSRAVVELGKSFFYKQLEMTHHDAYAAGAKVMSENVGSCDGREGIQSFIEKRKPRWIS